MDVIAYHSAGATLPDSFWLQQTTISPLITAASGPLHLYPSTHSARGNRENIERVCKRNLIIPCGGWVRESCRHKSFRWVPLRCHKWSCSQCSPGKKAEFYQRLESAYFESIARGWTLKFVTLTWSVDVDKRRVRLALQRLVHWIRREFGYCEYVKIPEFTKRGRVHLHLAMITPFIHQKLLSKAWQRYSKAPVVDIRAVKDLGRLHVELSKYLTKGPAGRVTYSRRFPKSERPVQVKAGPCDACDGMEHRFEFCNEDMVGRYYSGEEHGRMMPGEPIFASAKGCGCWAGPKEFEEFAR